MSIDQGEINSHPLESSESQIFWDPFMPLKTLKDAQNFCLRRLYLLIFTALEITTEKINIC